MCLIAFVRPSADLFSLLKEAEASSRTSALRDVTGHSGRQIE